MYYLKLSSRLFAVIVIICLTCSVLVSAFPDTRGHWAEGYAIALYNKGILMGDDKGNANLGSNIKRSEFVAMLVRSLYPSKVLPKGTKQFNDVTSGHWSYDVISYAADEGIILGAPDHLFRPEAPIKREEIMLMLTRALNLTGGTATFSDVPDDYIYYNAIAAGVEAGLAAGYPDGSFMPKASATRGEAAALLCRMLKEDPAPTPSPAPVTRSDKINLTWHQVYAPNVTKTGNHMTGLNTISPMWFRIVDNTGKTPYSYETKLTGQYYLQDLGNAAYIADCKAEGYDVWPMFKADFSNKEKSAFFRNEEARAASIRAAEQAILKYGLQGINLDFEDILVADRDLYTQYAKEMAEMCHRLGVVLSVDVTKYDATGGNWSLCYDRAGLAQVVDYVALMAYDQNGTWSTKAGSVADLPWTEGAIKKTLEEVPAEKLILCIPFYTRLWRSQNGKVIGSSAIGMEAAQKAVAEAGATPSYNAATGQNYASWNKDNITYEIWLEDETSLKARLKLVDKYNLAGVASWSHAFATPNAWTIIDQNLN